MNTDARLELILRIFAETLYIDVMMFIGINISTVYTVLDASYDSIMSYRSLNGIPFDDTNDFSLSGLCRGLAILEPRSTLWLAVLGLWTVFTLGFRSQETAKYPVTNTFVRASML